MIENRKIFLAAFMKARWPEEKADIRFRVNFNVTSIYDFVSGLFGFLMHVMKIFHF